MRRLVSAVALASSLVLVAGCGTQSGQAAASSKPKASTPAPEKTFDVVGTFDLTDGSGWVDNNAGDNSCTGTDGYDDLTEGTQVVVKDAAGKVLAIGSLSSGQMVGGEVCSFAFTVHQVPKQPTDVYAVTVSHRGDINFKEADASDLSLTIG